MNIPVSKYSADHKVLDQIAHVLQCPGMFLDTPEIVNEEKLVYVKEHDQLMIQMIEYIPLAERCFVEILCNAGDNLNYTRRRLAQLGASASEMERIASGYTIRATEVTFLENSTISIKSWGKPLSVGMHSEYGIPIPTCSFGRMNSGRNYVKGRLDSGVHGGGSKYTNIFSELFKVIVCNAEEGLRFEQTWSNNMSVASEPIYSPYENEKESSVEIIYQLDFPRLAIEGYSDDYYALFTRYVMEQSFVTDVPIVLNGETLDLRGLEYLKVYHGKDYSTKTDPIHFEQTMHEDNGDFKQYISLYILDTPDEGCFVSFVNGIITPSGGEHVNSAYHALGDFMIKEINDRSLKELGSRAESMTVKELNRYKVTLRDVKKHFSILLTTRLVDPSFKGQSKSTLRSPKPVIVLDSDLINQLRNFTAFSRLSTELDAKQLRVLKSTNGRKSKHINSDKCEDANWAGTAKSGECSLYLAEGSSGATYGQTMTDITPNGRDTIGILPLKGKPLNVMNASDEQLANNEEYKELVKVLGLKWNKDYSSEQARKTLRYGRVVIMTDADLDGHHISGLLVLFFFVKFPSLVKAGYVHMYLSPIMRAYPPRSKTAIPFFREHDYQRWLDETVDNHKYRRYYYKGLGSSDEEEIRLDCKDPHYIVLNYDELASRYLRLAFDEKCSYQRKVWIARRQDSCIPLKGERNISEHIDKEVGSYSESTLIRAIPEIMDGLKDSQRKVLYGGMQVWKNKSTPKLRADRVIGKIGDLTHYHHNDGILHAVIYSMGHTYVGGPNMAFFKAKGRIGTRHKNGKDASAARYPYLKLRSIVDYVFPKPDRKLWDYRLEEGDKAEPRCLFPIVPLLLINGSSGISTGYMTHFPCYDPHEIITWIQNYLIDPSLNDGVELMPWYNGFTGEIIPHDRNRKNEEDNSLHDDCLPEDLRKADMQLIDESEYYVCDKRGKRRIYHSALSRGRFHMDTQHRIHIEEIPIGESPYNYRLWLDSLICEKRIKTFDNHCAGDKIHFIIEGWTGPLTHKALRLERHIPLSNMTALVDGKPRRFIHVEQVLELFCKRRLQIYHRRVQLQRDEIASSLDKAQRLQRVIQAIVSKQLKVAHRSTADVMKDMQEMGLDSSLFPSLSYTQSTKEGLDKLEAKKEELQRQLDELNAKPVEDFWYDELQQLSEQL